MVDEKKNWLFHDVDTSVIQELLRVADGPLMDLYNTYYDKFYIRVAHSVLSDEDESKKPHPERVKGEWDAYNRVRGIIRMAQEELTRRIKKSEENER